MMTITDCPDSSTLETTAARAGSIGRRQRLWKATSPFCSHCAAQAWATERPKTSWLTNVRARSAIIDAAEHDRSGKSSHPASKQTVDGIIPSPTHARRAGKAGCFDAPVDSRELGRLGPYRVFAPNRGRRNGRCLRRRKTHGPAPARWP